MIVVTHEMGFAREAADKISFMDQGQLDDKAPAEFFNNAEHESARRFLSQIL